MKTSTVLKRALRLLDGGRRWIKGAPFGTKRGVKGACYCCVGALQRANHNGIKQASLFFERVIDDQHLPNWNDAPHRRWSHVEAAFKRAIKLAEKEERR